MKGLEFTEDIIGRVDEMDQAVYKMCLVFLQLKDDEADVDTKFPWDISIIQEIYDFTVCTLRKNKYLICDPSIIREDEEKVDQFCKIEECGFRECKLHL